MDTLTLNLGRIERNDVLGLLFNIAAILLLSSGLILDGRPAPFLCRRDFLSLIRVRIRNTVCLGMFVHRQISIPLVFPALYRVSIRFLRCC